MASLRKSLHSAVLFGMIPLALFSGMPATACRCADGHLKLFCGGHYAAPASHSKSALPFVEHVACSSCCQHGHADEDFASSGSNCCQSRHGSSQPCGKCCKQISKVLTTTVASVSLPALDAHVFAVLPSEVVVPHAFLSLRNAQLERVDSGPPVDLVITLRTLLI